jgi:hypothetical protein
MAYRSVQRPSSPLGAKASTKRPSLRLSFALGHASQHTNRSQPVNRHTRDQKLDLTCYHLSTEVLPTSAG